MFCITQSYNNSAKLTVNVCIHVLCTFTLDSCFQVVKKQHNMNDSKNQNISMTKVQTNMMSTSVNLEKLIKYLFQGVCLFNILLYMLIQ